MAKNRKIEVKGVVVTITEKGKEDFISLSDIATGFDGGTGLIEKWIRNKNTIEFLAVWEAINNPDFNISGHKTILGEVGTNRFMMSVKKWVALTNAIGITANAGRYGGTFACREIAIEFATWLNPLFKMEIIGKIFQFSENYETVFQNVFNEQPDFGDENTVYDVYLMQDLSTKHFKIGMSKYSGFREKTLQSQKPSVVMLGSKSFPSKKEAYHFEQKMHAKYEDKRLRGEWFDLSASNLQEIDNSFKQ